MSITRISCILAAIERIEAALAGLSFHGGAAHGSPTPSFSAILQQAQASSPPLAEGAPASDLDPIINDAAARFQLDPALIHAVIRAESGYDPHCVSRAGAMGLMQLMPATARALGVTDPFDPAQNILAGARYLRQQLDRFGRADLALAAYNAGPNAVARCSGIPPFSETQAYVHRVLRYWRQLANQPI